jgi:hypothetical protein
MTTITINNHAILKGWQDTASGLRHIPLKSDTTNNNTDTALLSYKQSKTVTDEILNNVFELPSKPVMTRYLHAAEGVPKKQRG